MPFPGVGEGFETFFEPTRIWLFGKLFPSLVYNAKTMSGTGDVPGAENDATHANEFTAYDTSVAPPTGDSKMPPRRIERLLRRDGSRNFARVYSFSYEGHYYTLPRPVLFLLTGAGHNPQDAATAAGGVFPFRTKFSGVGARDWTFSEDIKVWAVDRKDLAVCLDMEVANYQELLLNPSMASGRGAASRGDMTSRGDMSSRGDMTSRGDMVGRGTGSFRGDMIGPHQG